METVAIVGVGLIGGSFGLALRAAGFKGRIVGVSSPATIDKAIARGAIDAGADLADAAGQADVVFLAAPILTILEQLNVIDEYLRPGTLITDAASTKEEIVERARATIRRGRFLGGHPMAGKEVTGIAAAEADLFRNRPWALCPNAPGDLERASEFVDWIRAFGARPVPLRAAEHDRIVAFTSHLPQLMSTALASVVGQVQGAELLVGPGLLDMTRLAFSPYRLWKDIFRTNKRSIQEAVRNLIDLMGNMERNLDYDSVEQAFEMSRNSAARIRKTPQNS